MGQVAPEHRCLRRLVVAYNAFFWVTGPGMIGLGIWLFIALGEHEPVIDRDEFSAPSFIVISAGGASVLAGLLGCLGGLNEHKRLLIIYSLLMFSVCAMEITATVLCFLSYDQAEVTIDKMLNSSMSEYDAQNDMTQRWDSIQTKLFCCGARGHSDWLTTPAYFFNVISPDSGLRHVTPVSCCAPRHNNTECNWGDSQGNPLYPTLLRQEGCLPAVVSWLRHIYLIAGWAVAGVGATMVNIGTGVILALSSVCCLKHAVSSLYS